MNRTANWNPWHGCKKLSPGCQNCYVYRADARYGGDASLVRKTADYDLPVRHARGGGYKLLSGTLVWTCFTSDFLLAEADAWRPDAWRMMRLRPDCTFFFITKRIDRLAQCLPPDWGAGYPNVRVACTMENQDRADYRMPLLRDAPICCKSVVCEPLLSAIDFPPSFGRWVRQVVVGGESGDAARVCRYEWVLHIRKQCLASGVPFHFKQTGYRFEKDGKLYLIKRPLQHSQARKAGVDTCSLYESLEDNV